MKSTRLSLLNHAAAGSDPAWFQIVELYQPLVYGWLRRHDVSHHDAEELTQDVLSVVVQELPGFLHSGRRGAFRAWLRQIAANRAKGFWRARKTRPVAPGTDRLLRMAEQLADDSSELSRQWDREHDHHVLRRLLRKIEGEFERATLTAFHGLIFEGARAEDLAPRLGMTIGAVYSAKSRVLRKLRQEAKGLIDSAGLV